MKERKNKIKPMVLKTVYVPTTYINEFGVIIEKNELKKFIYKTLNYSKYEETTNGVRKIYSIRQIQIIGQQTELNFG